MLSELMSKFFTGGFKVVRRRTPLRYKHAVGTMYNKHCEYNRLFNLSVLAGAGINNNGTVDVIQNHNKCPDQPMIYILRSPTPRDLVEFVQMEYRDPPACFHRVAFAHNVLYNTERFYNSTSQIEIDKPGVWIKNKANEIRLLALDRDNKHLIEVVETFLLRRNLRGNVAGIDVYDTWKNEIVHLDIGYSGEVLEMLGKK